MGGRTGGQTGGWADGRKCITSLANVVCRYLLHKHYTVVNTAVQLSYLSIGRQKNGVRLDVSVYDAVVVKKGKRLQASFAHCRNLLFVHSATQQCQLHCRFHSANWQNKERAFMCLGTNSHTGNLSLILTNLTLPWRSKPSSNKTLPTVCYLETSTKCVSCFIVILCPLQEKKQRILTTQRVGSRR